MKQQRTTNLIINFKCCWMKWEAVHCLRQCIHTFWYRDDGPPRAEVVPLGFCKNSSNLWGFPTGISPRLLIRVESNTQFSWKLSSFITPKNFWPWLPWRSPFSEPMIIFNCLTFVQVQSKLESKWEYDIITSYGQEFIPMNILPWRKSYEPMH